MLLAHVQLGIHWDPESLFHQPAFLEHGIVPPQVKDFAPFLVELHEDPVSPFLQVLQILLMTATPSAVANTSLTHPHSRFTVPAELQGVHSLPSLRLFIRTCIKE